MIDPRALQQHFQRVQQAQQPPKPEIPRIPDPRPLTAVQAIHVPVVEIEPAPFIEQEESVVSVPNIPEIKEEIKKDPINLIVDAQPPIEEIIVDEIEELEVTANEVEDKEDEYDPYGYYSGPRY